MINVTGLGTQAYSRSALKSLIKEQLKERARADWAIAKRNDIGKVILSCVPLDPEYFIQLNGQMVPKAEYPLLYEIYKDNYLSDKSTTQQINIDVYFVLPNCTKRALIMQDKAGKFDTANRIPGSNLDWRYDLNKLLDFTLDSYPRTIKNISESSENIENTLNTFTLNEPGNDAYVLKKSKRYSIEETASSMGPVRMENELHFNTTNVYFYTRHKF